MIELKHVSKTFDTGTAGGVDALKDVSLTIEDGDIYGIIGMSGAGKSTLVRCINLLERPTSGSVIVDGKDLTKLPQKELLLIRRSTILPGNENGAEVLQKFFGKAEPEFLAFISGPSRTADIERVLTLGVHGPLYLHAVLIND